MNLSKNEKPKSTRERERKREKERERERKREKERERERKRESKAKQTTHHQSQQKQPIAQNSNHSLSCSRCLLKIPTNSTYYYNSKKPDNYKFCSQECYQEWYGELCSKCHKKFLNLYFWNKEKYPNLIYCSDCYDKEKSAEIEKNKTYCFKCSVELTEFNNQTQPLSICDFCWERDLERVKGESKQSVGREKGNNLTATQAKTMTIISQFFRQYLNQVQATYGLDSPQYQKLEKEQKETIRVLEKVSEEEQKEYLDLMRELGRLLGKNNDLSSQEQQKMINLGQEADSFIEKLKRKQAKIEQQQKSKLILGIGCGVVGLGLIGIVVWLVIRRKKGLW